VPGAGRRGMNREGVPGKSPEEMYIQQKVRVLLMLRKMGSNLTASEEEFLRTYAGVVNSQLSQLPQHSIDQGAEDVVMAFSRSETEDRRQYQSFPEAVLAAAGSGLCKMSSNQDDGPASSHKYFTYTRDVLKGEAMAYILFHPPQTHPAQIMGDGIAMCDV
ncbi:hypothetical protein KIL84_022092, partial [Mauremys mutica]